MQPVDIRPGQRAGFNRASHSAAEVSGGLKTVLVGRTRSRIGAVQAEGRAARNSSTLIRPDRFCDAQTTFCRLNGRVAVIRKPRD